MNGHVQALRTLSGRAPGGREAAEVSSLVAAWDTLGWVHFRRGSLEKAEKFIAAAWLVGQHGEEGDHLAQCRGETCKCRRDQICSANEERTQTNPAV